MMEGEDPEVGNRSGKEGGSNKGWEVGEGEKWPADFLPASQKAQHIFIS